MKSTVRTAVTGLATLAVASTLAVAAPTAATAGSCRTAWGSTAERDDDLSRAQVTGVRAGRHACFDRLVVDLSGGVAGYSVRYVPQVRADGSGDVVHTPGGARLEVVVTAPAYDDAGRPTYAPRDRSRLARVSGRTFRSVTWAGSYEGQTTLGLGVRARLPFRVLVLDAPGDRSRLVVDVAHRW